MSSWSFNCSFTFMRDCLLITQCLWDACKLPLSLISVLAKYFTLRLWFLASSLYQLTPNVNFFLDHYTPWAIKSASVNCSSPACHQAHYHQLKVITVLSKLTFTFCFHGAIKERLRWIPSRIVLFHDSEQFSSYLILVCNNAITVRVAWSVLFECHQFKWVIAIVFW